MYLCDPINKHKTLWKRISCRWFQAGCQNPKTGCEDTVTFGYWKLINISSLFILVQSTWKQSWSWPRIRSRSCCVVLVELFLRTSFCWLKNNGSCWLCDNSLSKVSSLTQTSCTQTLLWDWDSLSQCPNLCRMAKSNLDPFKPSKNTSVLWRI